LPSIRTPTLVLSRPGATFAASESARFLAERIGGAKLVELPGNEALPWIGPPEPVLDEIQGFLTGTRTPPEPDRKLATVLVTDIVGSTERAAEIGDARWRELLAAHHGRVRAELTRFRGREVDTAGDGFLATFDGPARAVECAFAIRASLGEIGLQVRAGAHVGEIELVHDEVRGIAVHIGSRVGALARPSEVLVSQTVKDLVAGSGLVFEDAGEHELKGIPDRWRLYRVVG
jgi:class 3 adenylate cyclase